jgi:hypothetical protein
MNKAAFLILLAVLSACGEKPVPVVMTFPEAPPSLLEPAPVLTPMGRDQHNQLSNLIENANENYGKYRLLSERLSGWQEWYARQKSIFETVK